jgi:hypothetical protein
MGMSSCEKSRRYREKNPERYRETLRKYGNKTWVCACGEEVKNQYRTHHIRTRKHADKLELLKLKQELEQLKGVQNI